MILDIARREVITAKAENTLREVVELMDHYNVGCVVIVHNARPTGIVTDRDMALAMLQDSPSGRPIQEALVGEFMTRAPRTILEDEGITRALELMRASGVRRLPVVDHKGKLRGLVTLDDILEDLGHKMDSIAKMVRQQQRAPRRAALEKAPEFAIRG